MICPLQVGLPSIVNVNSRSYHEYDELVKSPGDEYAEDLYWEPSYEEELERLQIFFLYLEVRHYYFSISVA